MTEDNFDTDPAPAPDAEADNISEDQASRPNISENVNYVTSDRNVLQIGDDIGLTNKDPTLKKIMLGAGWDIKSLEGEPPDLDISCFILNKDDKTRKDPDFVFYNNMSSEEGEIRHRGDNRTGAGDGDDEQIDIDLQALPFEVSSIMIVLSIHEGDIKDLNFSTVRNVFVRIVNADSNEELCKLELPDKFLQSEKTGSAMKVAKLFRDGPKWRFHACSEIPEKGCLRTMAKEYDIIVI